MKEMVLSEEAREMQLGVYEHYKKGKYEVLGVVIHSETMEELVLYRALYGKKLTWVRPLDMFVEEVEVKGTKIPRFRFVGKNT